MTEIRYERAVDLLEAELGDELVGLRVEDGNCFGFNAVATSVWLALERPRSLEELKAALLAEYEVSSEECTVELTQLLGKLVEQKLVRTLSAADKG